MYSKRVSLATLAGHCSCPMRTGRLLGPEPPEKANPSEKMRAPKSKHNHKTETPGEEPRLCLSVSGLCQGEKEKVRLSFDAAFVWSFLPSTPGRANARNYSLPGLLMLEKNVLFSVTPPHKDPRGTLCSGPFPSRVDACSGSLPPQSLVPGTVHKRMILPYG